MTQPREISIITVAEKVARDKGGFDIVDTLGKAYLVGVKNSAIAENLIVGRASKVTLFSHTTGTYINTAELYDGMVDPPQTEPQVRTEPTMRATESHNKLGEGAARGMTVKEVGDMIRADRLKAVWGQIVAAKLVTWYRGEILGITKIDFDGKDLPKFE